MGLTWTRYAHGSACAYRTTTACFGAVERFAAARTASQARTTTALQAGTRPGRRIHQHHSAPQQRCGRSPAGREGR
ncbi:hypothetical protein [Streptomyces lavendulae]